MPEGNTKTDFDVIVVGGGLAGLTAAILLSRMKKNVLLIEKKTYPFHKVCGEYISNEVLCFLQSLGIDPFYYGASTISRLRISTPAGKNIFPKLDLGGFGISRYRLDEAMYKIALKNSSNVLEGTKVLDITFSENVFYIKTNTNKTYTTKLVIGSYGKRDVLDKKLNRRFIQSHTGYMGVKYHVKTDYPLDEVGLDNFKNGYCGIVKIEEDLYNICYLYKRNRSVNFNSIGELEENVLFKNPVIKRIFSDSDFIFHQPEVINEISFAPKKIVEDHILMCGDSAGLITPLCGNGMSIAIHSAKLLCELILNSNILDGPSIAPGDRILLEKVYKNIWKNNFSKRLIIGRAIQNIFGNTILTSAGIHCIHAIPSLERWLISGTHGTVIEKV
jgi:flavin-dependent dehydrogenase